MRGSTRAAIAILAAAVVPTTAAAGAWQPQQALSASGQSAGTAAVATSPDGTATVVWSRYSGSHDVAQATSRTYSGAWSAPVDLSDPSHDALQGRVAVAADGRTTAIWVEFTGMTNVVRSATRPPGGAWSAATDVSIGAPSISLPSVAAAPDGTMTAIWERSGAIQSATLPPAGTWSAPVTLPSGTASQPDVAVATDGTAIAVWLAPIGSRTVVLWATRPVGGTWTTPAPLSDTAANAGWPGVVTGPDRSIAAVWTRNNGSNDVVQSSYRLVSGNWEPPANLSEPGASASAPEIAIGPDGHLAAVWSRQVGTVYRIQTASRPTLGSWNGAVSISAATSDASAPHVVVTAAGTTIAGWHWYGGSRQVVQASTSQDGAAWTLPEDLATGTGDAVQVRLAAATNGVAYGVWNQSDGTKDLVHGAVLLPDPPVATALPTIAGKPRVRKTLTCKVGSWARATGFTYRWLRKGKPIAKATKARYKVSRRDRRKTLTCEVTATGIGGTATAVSGSVRVR